VIGWKEAVFDPFDISASARKLRQVLVNEEFRAALARMAGSVPLGSQR
jgi:hypothetical protein